MSDLKHLRDIMPTPIEVRSEPLWWQKRGLSYTVSGYGGKIPTDMTVMINGRKHRIYVMIYSNSGSAYVLINNREYFLDEFDIVRK